MSRITSLTCITFILSCILLCSCSSKESVAKTEHMGPPRDPLPRFLRLLRMGQSFIITTMHP